MNIQKNKSYSLFLVLFLSFSLFSCEYLETEPATNFTINFQELVDLVNKARTEGCTCGSEKMPAVGKITWNETLAKTAYLHSKDMNLAFPT